MISLSTIYAILSVLSLPTVIWCIVKLVGKNKPEPNYSSFKTLQDAFNYMGKKVRFWKEGEIVTGTLVSLNYYKSGNHKCSVELDGSVYRVGLQELYPSLEQN